MNRQNVSTVHLVGSPLSRGEAAEHELPRNTGTPPPEDEDSDSEMLLSAANSMNTSTSNRASSPVLLINSPSPPHPQAPFKPIADPDGFLRPKKRSTLHQHLHAILIGLVNGVIILPVVISFAQIIFRDPYFTGTDCPFCMPYLIKLVVLSTMVHQICFTFKSTLPFAIGQVQDAGLIFLSTMASKIVHTLHEDGYTHDDILATVLCWIAISTALLGVALWVTGYFRLASLVQYLPMPVIGGYLAFIGLYCLEAGFSLMSGKTVENVPQWSRLLNYQSVVLILPGVLLGILLTYVVRRFRHFLVLPGFLVAIPVIFYICLACSQHTLEDARNVFDSGFVAQKSPESQFWLVWEHYNFARMKWYVVPSLLPTWVAMYFVVAFSSSLDVAAIQMELGRPLNFNAELKMVGLSNFMSGITGGFTGSYIFSQTIFTMRSNVHSRLVGVVVVIFAAITFMIPTSILAYLPKCLFGAILTFIAIDLCLSWLWHSRKLVRVVEYCIIWLTFIAINGLNLEYGMLVGVGLSVLVFIFEYASARNTRKLRSQSNVIRSFGQRRFLNSMHSSIVTIELHGHVFFGTALRMLREIKTQIIVQGNNCLHRLSEYDQVPPPRLDPGSMHRVTHYVVLQCDHVTGLDATAVRSLFVELKQVTHDLGIVLVLAGLTPSMERLLRAHQVLPATSSMMSDRNMTVFAFPDLMEALEWCEEKLLLAHTIEAPEDLIHTFQETLVGEEYDPAVLTNIYEYVVKRTFVAEEVVYMTGTPSDTVCFVQSGEFDLQPEHGGASLRYMAGCMFGQVSFSLRVPRDNRAVCVRSGIIYSLDRDALARMERNHPALAALTRMAILNSVCIIASANSSSRYAAH
eukprot:m.64598 g.64598  ORF g.64598 m.64598 type:complete len:858 (-) comp13933_c1_seq1:66-2639(-)